MKLLPLLVVLVVIIKADLNIHTFVNGEALPGPVIAEEPDVDARNPPEDASRMRRSEKDRTLKVLGLMRTSLALNFKDDSQEARRHFVDNEVGPLRTSRGSDSDINGISQDEVNPGHPGYFPVSDDEEDNVHIIFDPQEGLEGDIVDGSGEELDGFRDEDVQIDFNGDAEDEDEDGMEFQGWGSKLAEGAKKFFKGGFNLLKTGLKTAGRGVKHGLKRAGSLVKNGVKKALPHLKEVGREVRDRAKTFIKEDGMDILFDGIRGAMGRGSGGNHGPSPADYGDTDDDGASDPYYGHEAERREEYGMPKRGNRGSKRDHGNRDEDGDREAAGHQGAGSRRHSRGGKSGGHDDKDFEDDDASENDNDDAEENRGAEKRAGSGKPRRDNNRDSQRGSGSRDEDEGASGYREEEESRPIMRNGGKRGSSGGGEKKPARTEKSTERGPSGKPKYNFKKGQSAEDAAGKAFKQFAERMGDDIAEKYRDKITECIEDAFFDKNHEADDECSRFFKQ